MSRDTREWAWESSASRGNARLVLLSIADRVPDEQCVAWASLTSLMKRTNASRNAVRGALAALADSGELEVLDDLDGPQHSTVYRLPRAAAWLAKVAAARGTVRRRTSSPWPSPIRCPTWTSSGCASTASGPGPGRNPTPVART